jgi:hypothetical protein
MGLIVWRQQENTEVFWNPGFEQSTSQRPADRFLVMLANLDG